MTTHAFVLNGQSVTVEADPDMPVLWALRDLLGLTGTKYGCGVGQCRTCTIHLDGAPVPACQITMAAVAGQAVTTIEGLGPDHALQRAWIAEQVPQCGYCQSGQLMAAAALLAQDPKPSDEAITTAMSGNLCRCGTYARIHRAVRRASEEA